METEKLVSRRELSTAEASRLSGLSLNQITHLLRQGKLEGRRFGQRIWIVYADSLEHYLATPHKSGPKGPRAKTTQSAVDATKSTAKDTGDGKNSET
jgi:hypothetical protein